MNRRLTLVAAALAAASILGGAGAARADLLDQTPDPTVDAYADERYWACVAVDHVEVGACLSNPYPDLSQYPTVPEVVHELTGVRLPGVPRP